jgi:type II restriction enzyme SfiI
MFIDTADLLKDPEKVEEIEKASARLVTQAVYELRVPAAAAFERERDLPQDIAEDLTREALDRLGVSRMEARFFGKMDYKRARYVFHPDYSARQALFVDSKAEKECGTSTLQTSQTSMRIRHIRRGYPPDIPGDMPPSVSTERGECITTTVFVKYEY